MTFQGIKLNKEAALVPLCQQDVPSIPSCTSRLVTVVRFVSSVFSKLFVGACICASYYIVSCTYARIEISRIFLEQTN